MKVVEVPSFVIFVSVKPLNFTAMKGFIEVKDQNGVDAIINVSHITYACNDPQLGTCLFVTDRKQVLIISDSYSELIDLIKEAIA